MKKKLLSVFLAVAVAFTFSFAMVGTASADDTGTAEDLNIITWNDDYSECKSELWGKADEVTRTMAKNGTIEAKAGWESDDPGDPIEAIAYYVDLTDAVVTDAKADSADAYMEWEEEAETNDYASKFRAFAGNPETEEGKEATKSALTGSSTGGNANNAYITLVKPEGVEWASDSGKTTETKVKLTFAELAGMGNSNDTNAFQDYAEVTPTTDYTGYNEAIVEYTISEHTDLANADNGNNYLNQYGVRGTATGKLKIYGTDEATYQNLKLKVDGIQYRGDDKTLQDLYLKYEEATDGELTTDEKYDLYDAGKLAILGYNQEYDGIFTYDGEEHALNLESENIDVEYAEYLTNSDGQYLNKVGEFTTEAPVFKDVSTSYIEPDSTFYSDFVSFAECDYDENEFLVPAYKYCIKVSSKATFLPSKANVMCFDVVVVVKPASCSGTEFTKDSYTYNLGDEITVSDIVKLDGVTESDEETFADLADKYLSLTGVPTEACTGATVGIAMDESIYDDPEALSFLYNYNIYPKHMGWLSDRTASFTMKEAAIEQKENDIDFGGTAGYKTYKAKKGKLAKTHKINIKAVSDSGDTVTFKLKNGDSKIKINKSTGVITVKKGLKKGTYNIKVIGKVAETKYYTSAEETHNIKIKVK